MRGAAMTPKSTSILLAVPLGHDHAAGSRQIAAKFGAAPGTVHEQLNALVTTGAVRRCVEQMTADQWRWLYWREHVYRAAAPPQTMLDAG